MTPLNGQRLDGRTALITGADGALGRLVAVALAERGASLALVHRGRRPAALDTLQARLAELGTVVEPVRTPSLLGPDIAAVFDAAIDRFEGVDVVVHTPGLVVKKPLTDVTDDEFEASLDANVRAAFFVLREAGRRLRDNGRIITLSTSITAVTTPRYGDYAPHKAATEHYVRALAKELGERGITVNAVAPGPIESEFYHSVEDENSARVAASYSGAGRLGEWTDIVPAITFLCTPDARWITAQTIRVNGGMAA